MRGYVKVENEDFTSAQQIMHELLRREGGTMKICEHCKSPYLVHSTYSNTELCIICSNERLSTVNKGLYKEMSKSKGWYKK
jgi:hypothetical protein